jgi:hypothetical protein
MMSSVPPVDFQRYILHEELSDYLRKCQEAAPELMTLTSIGASPAGRELWLATITDPSTGAADSKPAYYVQAHAHAHEMYGTTAALHLIHTLLTAPEARELLSRLTFYVVPRVTPDGGEYAISTEAAVRSRVHISDKLNGVIPQDLDGDGLIMNMRWEDPAGPFAVDPEDDRILVPRRPGDVGPFYYQCVEGLIHEYDGGPLRTSTQDYDFNRNFPVGWQHTTDAANYPLELPETRAVADFLFSHPNIYAGIDFHGGTPAILHPDNTANFEVSDGDRDLILEIGKMGERHTNIKLLSSRDYRASWRKPSLLPGCSKDFAHFGLGISWYVIEVGWGYSSAGIYPDESFDALQETKERDFVRRIMRFGDEHADTDTRVLFVPWEDYDHPQLGRVQIGGLTSAGRSHVYPPEMEQISTGTSSFILEHATYHPQIMLSGFEAVKVGANVYRIRGRVANVGRFATNVMSTGFSSRVNKPVQASVEKTDGIEVLSRQRVFEFEALGGGGGDFRALEWFVSAEPGAEITVRASHPRGGTCSQTLTLP